METAAAGWTRADGKVFDSSVKRGTPFDFTLGQGMVIKGWDQGLSGMCVGERRRLTIPSDLGYGSHGSGASIPGGATLVFDVELLEVSFTWFLPLSLLTPPYLQIKNAGNADL